jgi:hypothetical protein
MSIAYVIYSIVTQKNMEIKKTFRHIEIMIFTTLFVNRFFRTHYEKKVKSGYNTQKKINFNTQKNWSQIIEMFIKSNKEIK